MNILISGATGLIGTQLVKQLRARNHSVHILTRKKTGKPDEFVWDLKNNFIEDKAFEGIDTIIHLAGANIGKRWTKHYKKEIISSRVDTAQLILNKAKELNIYINSYISSSGINYYGTYTSDKIIDEKSEILHKDFLSDVCSLWEKSALKFNEISKRIVYIRTAPVLSETGGTFESLKKISDFNLASGIGSGQQWFNWIHIDDLINIYIKAVEDNNMNGAYNAVADEILTNKIFMKLLAKTNKKLFFPINIPGFMIKLLMGEMSEIILEGTRISNKKIKSEGFVFKFPDLKESLKDLLKK